MATEKYYGTNLSGGLNVPRAILEKYNARNNHNQFRVVCKAKSRATADRTMQGILNLTGKVFDPAYTSETGNKEELEMCDKYTAIISLDNGQRKYFSLQEIYDEVQEFRLRMQ